MLGLFKINEESAFGPGPLIPNIIPGPKADSKRIPSDPKKKKELKLKLEF